MCVMLDWLESVIKKLKTENESETKLLSEPWPNIQHTKNGQFKESVLSWKEPYRNLDLKAKF